MSSLSDQQIREALGRVPFPGFDRDVVSVGAVRDVAVDGGAVQVRLQLGPGSESVVEPLRDSITAALSALDGVESVSVSVTTPQASASSSGLRMAGQTPSAAAAGGADPGLLPGVKHVIAVASGKGGVGKSTVAVNLAVSLARSGRRVGLLDADIYGPSIPLMMGVDERPRLDESGNRLIPFERHGVRMMSLGFLVEKDSAVIWRGPMVMKALDQLLRDVVWGELDVLVVDMPPGTGDAQLTMSQRVQLAGAVIVTTPQDVALADAVKGVAMFRKVDVPLLGLVENMSYFACPGCGERSDIFGHGGGKDAARRLGIPFLGEVPLHPAIRDSGDRGEPVAAAQPEGPQGQAFNRVAHEVWNSLDGDGGSVFDRFRKKFGR
ncbi:hypothetical protein ABI59_02770 [Acidobacteria bacterium Mor1]|nr:hypothetical protein ABI59_02770 [Acidobacteria bacterium Mor1]